MNEYIHLRSLMQLHTESAFKYRVEAFNNLECVGTGIDCNAFGTELCFISKFEQSSYFIFIFCELRYELMDQREGLFNTYTLSMLTLRGESVWVDYIMVESAYLEYHL
jgi:hypothetical protein